MSQVDHDKLEVLVRSLINQYIKLGKITGRLNMTTQQLAQKVYYLEQNQEHLKATIRKLNNNEDVEEVSPQQALPDSTQQPQIMNQPQFTQAQLQLLQQIQSQQQQQIPQQMYGQQMYGQQFIRPTTAAVSFPHNNKFMRQNGPSTFSSSSISN